MCVQNVKINVMRLNIDLIFQNCDLYVLFNLFKLIIVKSKWIKFIYIVILCSYGVRYGNQIIVIFFQKKIFIKYIICLFNCFNRNLDYLIYKYNLFLLDLIKI